MLTKTTYPHDIFNGIWNHCYTNTPNQIPSGFQPVEIEPEHKYKAGDKVKVDFSQDEYEVVEQTGVNLWRIPEYMLKETNSGNIVYNMESEIRPISEGASSTVTKYKPKCQCGAYTTYGEDCAPMFHSTWCTIYKNDKGKT